MPTQYRKPGTGSDARGMKRKPPTAAAIEAAMKFYAGARPPPDPQKKTVDLAPTRPTAYSSIRQQQNITPTLMLATLMPRTYSALVANGATLASLAQVLPATAAALSGVLR